MEKKLKHKEVIKLVKRNEAKEVLSSLAGYAQKNTENIIIAVAAVAVIAVGVPLFMSSRANNEVKAQQILAKANFFLTRPVVDQKDAQMYGMFRTRAERTEKAIMAYNEVIQNYKGTKSLAYAYLGVADAYYNDSKAKESIEYYNTFIERFPKHALASQAYLGRARAYMDSGNYAQALEDLKAAAAALSGSPVDEREIRYLTALCHEKMNDLASARKEYSELAGEGGGNYWAGLAAERLKEAGI
ncbi:MAG TPA: tetratricopeptide repeat protein [Candidatus Goldiibacteriota bacterium]|nr:tetratricopeptide repeat protein [Candidatus Goldiibacteriota bacterium]